MTPEKRKRAKERTEEWVRTDPKMQALWARIEYHRTRRLAREGQVQPGRIEPGRESS
jgi:hypothetical protein